MSNDWSGLSDPHVEKTLLAHDGLLFEEGMQMGIDEFPCK